MWLKVKKEFIIDDLINDNTVEYIIKNKNMAYLRQFPNVVMTQHLAFYTDAAVSSMVQLSLNGLWACYNDLDWDNELTKDL